MAECYIEFTGCSTKTAAVTYDKKKITAEQVAHNFATVLGASRAQLITKNQYEKLNKSEEIDDTQKIVSDFNRICGSYMPKVTVISPARKARIKDVSKQINGSFIALFERVAKSDFLTGRSGVWKGCCFDWILKPANLIKILEGNYDNKEKNTQRDTSKASYDLEAYEKSSMFD